MNNYPNHGFLRSQPVPAGQDSWFFAPGTGGPTNGGGGYAGAGAHENHYQPGQQLLPPYPQTQNGPSTFANNPSLSNQANQWLNTADAQAFLEDWASDASLLPARQGQSPPSNAVVRGQEGTPVIIQNPAPHVRPQPMGPSRGSRFQAAVEAAPARPTSREDKLPDPKDFPWVKAMGLIYLWFDKIVLLHPINDVALALHRGVDIASGQPLDPHGRLDLEIIDAFYTLVPPDDLTQYKTKKKIRSIMNKGLSSFRSMISHRCRSQRSAIFAKSPIAPHAGKPLIEVVNNAEWCYLIGYDTATQEFTATMAIPPMLFELDSNGHPIPGTEFRVECALNCLKLTVLGADCLSNRVKLSEGRKNIAQQLEMTANASVIALGGMVAIFSATPEGSFTEVGATTKINFGETFKTYHILVDRKIKAGDPEMLRTLDYYNEHVFGIQATSTQASSPTPATDQAALRAQRFEQAARSAGMPAPPPRFGLQLTETAGAGRHSSPNIPNTFSGSEDDLASEFGGLTTHDQPTSDESFPEVDMAIDSQDYAAPSTPDNAEGGGIDLDIQSVNRVPSPLPHHGILKPPFGQGARRGSGKNVSIDVERNETLIISARPFRAQSQDAEGEDDEEVEIITPPKPPNTSQSPNATHAAGRGMLPPPEEHAEDMLLTDGSLCPLCDVAIHVEQLSTLFRNMLNQALEHSIKTPRATNPDGVGFLHSVPSPHPVCIRHNAEPLLLEQRAHEYPDIDWSSIEGILRSSATKTRLAKLVSEKSNTRGKNVFWKAYLEVIGGKSSTSIEALGYCGYYGKRGQSVVAKVLKDMFPFDGIMNAVSPATPEDYHQAVLVPTAVQLLIADAMKISQTKAHNIMSDSHAWGLDMYPGGEEDELWYTHPMVDNGVSDVNVPTVNDPPPAPSQVSRRPKPKQTYNALKSTDDLVAGKNIITAASSPPPVPSPPTSSHASTHRNADTDEVHTLGANHSVATHTGAPASKERQGEAQAGISVTPTLDRVVVARNPAVAIDLGKSNALPSTPALVELYTPQDAHTAEFARANRDTFKQLVEQGVIPITPGLRHLLLLDRQQHPQARSSMAGASTHVAHGQQALGLGHPSSRPHFDGPRNTSQTSVGSPSSSIGLAPTNARTSSRIVSDSTATLGRATGTGGLHELKRQGSQSTFVPPGSIRAESMFLPPRSLNNGARNVSDPMPRQQTASGPVIRTYSATQILQLQTAQNAVGNEMEPDLARRLREIDEAPESDESDGFESDTDYMNSNAEGCR